MYTEDEIGLIKFLTQEIFDFAVELALKDQPDLKLIDGSVVGLSWMTNSESSIEHIATYFVNCEMAEGDWFQIKFIKDREEIERVIVRLALRVKPSYAKLNELGCSFSAFYESAGLFSSIALYLGCTGFRAPNLPTTRKPFSVPSEYSEVMHMFVLNGYALKNADTYIWTNKIAKFMRFAVLWNNENQSISDKKDQEAELREVDVIEAWNCIPDFFSTKIFELDKSERAGQFAAYYLIYYREGEWTFEQDDSSFQYAQNWHAQNWLEVKKIMMERSIF